MLDTKRDLIIFQKKGGGEEQKERLALICGFVCIRGCSTSAEKVLPRFMIKISDAGPEGFEPSTNCSACSHSIQTELWTRIITISSSKKINVANLYEVFLKFLALL